MFCGSRGESGSSSAGNMTRVRDFLPAKKEIGICGPAGSKDPTSPVVPVATVLPAVPLP